MSQRLRFLIAILLGVGLGLVGNGDAQVNPTWQNDAQGRPAPPCMVLDPTTGLSSPCSATAPLPVSGGGAGLGTTGGTSTTGFGKQWFPSTITGSVASGQLQAAFFIDDLQVAFLRRSTICANCLQVAISTDGGVTGTFFSTAAIIGNSVSTAHRVPSATPSYLVSNIGGPLNIFQSFNLSSGWTTVAGLTTTVNSWASNTTGSTVLSYASPGANVEVCRSTNQGVSFTSCALWGATVTGAIPGQGITYAGGTTWLFHNNAGEIWRSTNDGVTFALVTTIGGNGRSIRCQPTSFATCFYTGTDANIYRSVNAGLTWVIQQSNIGAGLVASLCAYDSAAVATINNQPPVGFGAIAQNAFTSLNAGINWFAGQTNGSHWDSTGAVTTRSMDCRNGRGIATYDTTGGGTNVFAVYNPLTQPGGVLQSSAGGYSVTVPIQAGIILNTTPTTSAANTAATVTATNTAGSRICIRRIVVFPTGGAGTFTLTAADGVTTVLNFGTVTALAAGATVEKEGTPLYCTQTGNNAVVNVGAAGAGVTTTTSVVGDRYPN